MTELTLTGARAMSPTDLVAFIVLTIEKLAGTDILAKYNHAHGAHGHFASSGGGGGGGGEHGSGGGVEHAGGSHGHPAVGHEAGSAHGAAAGSPEKGSVYVGSKDSVGEIVSHPVHGQGTVTAIDAKNGTVTVTHPDGASHTYAAAFAPQKAKLVATGSEQGKTHIANVKTGKAGIVTNKDDGKTIGHVTQESDGTWRYTHAASGETTAGYSSKHTAIKGLIDEHNAQAGKKPAAEESKPKPESKPAEEAKPKPAAEAPKPAPGYHKAGTNVMAADITVKKDGTAIHKPTGEVLGTIGKSPFGGWNATHANGEKVQTYKAEQKKGAVVDLANKHNQTVALEKSVKPNESQSWSKDAAKVEYSETKPLDGNANYYSNHVAVHAGVTGEKLGEVKLNPDGGYDITHVSGAAYHVDVNSMYKASANLKVFHNSAVERAEGKAPEPAKAPEPTGTVAIQPYEHVKSVSAYDLKSSNVQKDENGKITGSDVLSSNGTKIGYTKANADGTMDVYHADGTKVASNAKPGTGQATNAIATHHNDKYGVTTPSAYTSSHAASMSVPPPADGHAGKFAHTDASEAEGGIHNDPGKSYTPPTEEQVKSNFSHSSTHGSLDTLYAQPKSTELGLKPAERAALKSYTGSGYSGMNSALRTGKSNESINKKIDDLDKAFLKTPPLEHTTTSYRCISHSAADKLLGVSGSKVGKTFTDPGYGSTGAVPQKQFGPVTMRVTLPAGSHVLRPDGLGTYGDKETELLLPRGTQYKVVRDEVVDGHRQVDLVVVGSSQH